MHVLVAGGGVIGCSIAYYLSRAGAEVTLVERQRIGAGASSAAAGMLAPLAESSDPGPFLRLALQGLEAFHSHADELIDESGIDFEFRRDGVLRVAETATEEARLRDLVALQPQAGLEAQWLDRAPLTDLEPLLAPAISGALYSRREGHVNPGRLTAALADAAAARGARLLEGQEVERFELDGSRVVALRTREDTIGADQFVLAGGAWTAEIALGLGAMLPLAPVRGQMLALRQAPTPIRHIIYSQDGYLVPKPDGSIWVGATEEHDAGFDTAVTAGGLRWLLSAAERLVPALDRAAYLRSWAGLRPCSADGLPILGPLTGLDNVHVATGHFRNGILLSLVTGRLMADLLTSGTPSPELTPFLPKRFAGSIS